MGFERMILDICIVLHEQNIQNYLLATPAKIARHRLADIFRKICEDLLHSLVFHFHFP